MEQHLEIDRFDEETDGLDEVKFGWFIERQGESSNSYLDSVMRNLPNLIHSRLNSWFMNRVSFIYKKGYLLGRYQNGELFPGHFQILQNLIKMANKVRHFNKRPNFTELSKWRTFMGRSYQNGELFESEILVATNSLLVIS